MKIIEIEDDLYAYIASQTQHIGESASQILRRLVMPAGSYRPELDAGAEGIEEAQPKADLFELLENSSLSSTPKMVARFLIILSVIAKVEGERFAQVLSISGRNRVYFAKDKETLLKTGSSTNPKAIPHSDFWVITNNNTNKKVAILAEVLGVLGYSSEEIERMSKMFLQADTQN